MRTAGIDLAAAEANTAVCVIDWAGDRTSVRFETDTSDEGLLRICREVDKVGIDCPFGWPVPFVQAVQAHHDGRPWPGQEQVAGAFHDTLKFRQTDLYVRRELNKVPLAVAADKIAVVAMRCARLLSALGCVDRTGVTGRVAEVYPAASLHQWRLRSKGYKGVKNRHLLRGLLDELLQRFPELTIPEERRAECIANDHRLDALVCALTAREAVEGRTTGPEPGSAAERAAVEGWIHIPHAR